MKRDKKKQPFKKWTAWNNVPNKPDEANCVSKSGDIVAKIGQVWCLCQRKNDYNNIVVFIQPGKFMPQMDVYRCLFAFAYRLRRYAGVEYLTIQGRKGRYDFLMKILPPPIVVPGDIENDWQLWFMHITDDAMKRLLILKKGF